MKNSYILILLMLLLPLGFMQAQQSPAKDSTGLSNFEIAVNIGFGALYDRGSDLTALFEEDQVNMPWSFYVKTSFRFILYNRLEVIMGSAGAFQEERELAQDGKIEVNHFFGQYGLGYRIPLSQKLVLVPELTYNHRISQFFVEHGPHPQVVSFASQGGGNARRISYRSDYLNAGLQLRWTRNSFSSPKAKVELGLFANFAQALNRQFWENGAGQKMSGPTIYDQNASTGLFIFLFF